MSRVVIILFVFLPLYAQERIVALSPSISEIVFALGKGSALVGVSDYAAYPPEVKKIEKVGGYFYPNLEKIITLEPTLVITQSHHKKLPEQLQKFQIKTLSVKLLNLEDIKTGIATIARAIHAEEEAAKLIDAIDTAIKEAPKAKNRPSVLIVFGASSDLRDGIYVAGHDLYFDQIINICGAKNAYTEDFSGQPSLTTEGVIALNPDIVIILHSPLTDRSITPEQAKQLWETLPIKAANGRVTIMDASYLAIPSQRVARSIHDLCEVIARD